MKILSLTRAFATLAVLAFTVTSASAQTPVAHWTFDDGVDDYTQITVDDNAQAGTASDAVYADAGAAGLTYGVGQIGGAAFLSGENVANRTFEISSLATQLDFADAASFTGWFQPEVGPGADYKGLLMSRSVEGLAMNENWGTAWRSINAVDSRVGGAAVRSDDNQAAPDGSWYHFALVWDGDASGGGLNPTQRLYVDGVEVGDSPAATAITTIFSGGAWSIGRDPGQESSRNFRGGVDDFAVYNVALSAGQVSTLYNNGLGNGTTSTDASGAVITDFLAGDVDRNGSVDAGDYATIRDAMNSSVSGRDEGDLNADGLVNLDDFAEWRANAPGAVLASLGFVPEPSSLMLMGLAGLFGLGRSRRRS